jgi:deoxyribose-phosphate aldolase
MDLSAVTRENRVVLDLLDFTLLDHDASTADLIDFVHKANASMPAAVCIFAKHVQYIKEILASGILVVAVAGGFPVGDSSVDALTTAIGGAVAAGVDEVDFVLEPRQGDDYPGPVEEDILRQARAAAQGCTLKVILETSLLEEDAMAKAAKMALDCGVDFLKTSTGKRGGATPQSARILAATIREHEEATGSKKGIKLSGGIRSSEDAYGLLSVVRCTHPLIALNSEAMLCRADNARIRIGASSLLKELMPCLYESTSAVNPLTHADPSTQY